ncbi:MAG: FAD-binding oxidoreductase [Pseudomonadota bacterium]
MAHAAAISLWDRTAVEPQAHSDAMPDGPVDVAIVGGGFTGLSTALHAAEAGLSAHVLEANGLGFGGSGRNFGLVNAGVWLPPSKVRRVLGEPQGARFLARFGDGPKTVFDLIERHQIRCDATRTGTIHAAHARSGLKDLEDRHREWAKMGAPVTLLDREAMAAHTGTAAFCGGLLDGRAGTINPMAYVRGLARAARGAGARITLGTRATALHQGQKLWRVMTEAGEVAARAVVLGTNAYTDDLWPGLSKVFTTIHYFQLATEPLGEAAKTVLPGGQGLWDTAPVMRSVRRDREGRLIIGSMGRIVGGLSHRFARRQVARLFPQLGPVTFTDAWHGKIAMTADHMPRIHELAPGLWTPIGYNGRGITTGTLFGQAIAGLLTGAEPTTLPLPVTTMARARGARLVASALDLSFLATQAVRSVR